MIAVLISLPLWLAASVALFAGLVGMFNKQVPGGYNKLLALAMVGLSSLAFYGAAAMCGLV